MNTISPQYTWNLRVRARRNSLSGTVTLGLGGAFMDLDPVACSMWMKFEHPSTVEDAAQAIATDYATAQATVEPDVKEFVDTMKDAQMLSPVGGP